MGMQNPVVNEPLDKLSEHYPEGVPFFLTGIRVVKAKTADFGEGEMVVLRVRGHERELGVWGSYLLAQARAVDDGDLYQWYAIERRVVEGFGKGRAVKLFVPATAPPVERGASDQTAIMDPPGDPRSQSSWRGVDPAA